MANLVVPDIAMLREPNLLVPGKKPIGPVEIDWSHSISTGCEHFFHYCAWGPPPQDYVATKSIRGIDLVTGNVDIIDNTSNGRLYKSTCPFGPGIKGTGSVGWVITEAGGAKMPSALGTAPFTHVTWFYSESETPFTSNARVVNGERYSVFINASGQVYADIYFNIVGHKYFTSTQTLKVGFNCLVTTYEYGKGAEFILNGVHVGGISETNQLVTDSINHSAAVPGYTIVTALGISMFSRPLSIAEGISLSTDPYQFLKPAGT